MDALIQSYLENFDNDVVAIYEDEGDNKLFSSVYLISSLLIKFPELSPYVLSYSVNPSQYSFFKYYPNSSSLPDKISFLEFLIRFGVFYFPAFIHIQQALCCNPLQPIVTQLDSGKTITLHEIYIQNFLEMILKILNEEISPNGEFNKTPQALWKWKIYAGQAIQLFSCSSFQRTKFPHAVFKDYVLFILKCLASCHKKESPCNYEVASCLMSLLHQLLDLVLLKGIDERLQDIRHLFQSRVWDKIKGGKKFMELTAFYARMSRDNLLRDKVDLNEAFESKDFTVTSEEIYNNEELQRELLNHQLKNLPLLGNKMRQCKVFLYIS